MIFPWFWIPLPPVIIHFIGFSMIFRYSSSYWGSPMTRPFFMVTLFGTQATQASIHSPVNDTGSCVKKRGPPILNDRQKMRDLMIMPVYVQLFERFNHSKIKCWCSWRELQSVPSLGCRAASPVVVAHMMDPVTCDGWSIDVRLVVDCPGTSANRVTLNIFEQSSWNCDILSTNSIATVARRSDEASYFESPLKHWELRNCLTVNLQCVHLIDPCEGRFRGKGGMNIFSRHDGKLSAAPCGIFQPWSPQAAPFRHIECCS